MHSLMNALSIPCCLVSDAEKVIQTFLKAAAVAFLSELAFMNPTILKPRNASPSRRDQQYLSLFLVLQIYTSHS